MEELAFLESLLGNVYDRQGIECRACELIPKCPPQAALNACRFGFADNLQHALLASPSVCFRLSRILVCGSVALSQTLSV
eukprot:5896513-Amphidinium_carterae.2